MGAAVFDITPENFRQRLSRARRDLRSFMENQCGLVDPATPCRCSKKTRAYVQAGVVNPSNLRFHRSHLRKVNEVVAQKSRRLEAWVELFRDHPFQNGPDLVPALRSVIHSPSLLETTEMPRRPPV